MRFPHGRSHLCDIDKKESQTFVFMISSPFPLQRCFRLFLQRLYRDSRVMPLFNLEILAYDFEEIKHLRCYIVFKSFFTEILKPFYSNQVFTENN